MEFTKHFQQMMTERNIHPKWVEETLAFPDQIEHQPDGTCHYIKQIAENGNRWIRIVINIQAKPNRAITAFFDRRLKGMKI